MFFQIALTVIGAFLSVILTKFLIQNGRAIEKGFRKMDERTKEIAEGITKATKEIAEGITKATKEIAALIVQEGKGIKELIKEK